MGCVSSHLLHHEDEFTQLGSSALSHHIVSLTSTTYGFLNLDPSPSPITPQTRFTFGSVFSTPLSEPRSLLSETKSLRSESEVINSWELMDGLDNESFRFSILPPLKPYSDSSKENSKPNSTQIVEFTVLDRFEKLCPPSGENRVVIYTTTLRGIRKTFEECNAVRAAIESAGVQICERDVSMDRGFREELRELMKGKDREAMILPKVFVRGRYIGGSEQVLKMADEGFLGELFHGLPKVRSGSVCEGCGNARFLPCFQCNGSCKMVMVVKEEAIQKHGKTLVVKCSDCNENGLVLCPICS